MITKAEILSIDYTGNTCTIRIPTFESAAGGDKAIIPAIFSTIPGIYNGYKEGDIVLVAFENGQIQNPVVIGKLYLGASEEGKEARGSINCTTLISENSASLLLSTKLTNDTPNLITAKSAETYKTIKDIINKKQDKLIAGTNITFTYDTQDNLVINATGGGSSASNLQNGTGTGSLQQNDGTQSYSNTYTSIWDDVYNNVPTIANILTKDPINKKVNVLTTGALGANSFQRNGKSLAHGKRSSTDGSSTIALGEGSHAEGNASISVGAYSHAEGNQCLAIGKRSHAEGSASFAGGDNSHAEGNLTKTTADSAHAEGSQTVASGGASHAEGQSTIAGANSAHAEGNNTHATGSNSHAEGLGTTASGHNSHAEGQNTDTNGMYNAHCEGNGTIAGAANQTVIGSYNDYAHDTTALFVVGNGGAEGSTTIRQDAFRVLYDGTIVIPNYTDSTLETRNGYKRIACINGVLTVIDE